MSSGSAKTSPISIARISVTRAATGKTETFYSYEYVPIWQFARWLRLQRHLRRMRAEDRQQQR